MAERVTFTAELQDEVSGPAQRMAASVATANRQVESSAARAASGTRRAASTIRGAGDEVGRGASAMERATRRAHGGVAGPSVA